MAAQYQVSVDCKARAASGHVVNIRAGTYSVTGDGSDSQVVRLVREAREIEISSTEFQRLIAAALVKRL